MKYIYSAAFLGCILAANYVTTRFGMVPVGFGLVATAGTYLAGLSFVLRDAIQDTAGKWAVLALIVLGAGLSLLLAVTWFRADESYLPPGVTAMSIALASGVAFLCSETADLAIYTPLRDRGYIRAAVASNIVGSFVDTVLFLWIAGFPIWSAFTGQVVGKLVVTLLVVAAVVASRGVRRQAVAHG